VLSSLGCGPVEYLNQVSSRASNALMLAQREDAGRYAPYEFTKASEYYRKAREEAGHSAYQAAIDYGRKCEELATKARAIARERSEREAGRKATAGSTAPAGDGDK
jgi:hypothetical protein